MLNPLAEIGIRMLMTVSVGRSQLMMDILSNCERRKREQQEDKTDRQKASDT